MLRQISLSFQPRHLLLPLVMASVAATGLTFVPQAVGITGRWVCLGLLAVYVVVRGRALPSMNAPVGLAAMGYVGWCVFTGFWSEVPVLSWTKGGALALTTFSALWGGEEWARAHPRPQSLNFLWPIAILALAAGASGSDEVFEAAGELLHAGATVNPNFLGTLAAMSFPFAIWRLLQRTASRASRVLWILVLTAFVALLYLAASRGAYLISLGTTGGLLLALKPRKWVTTVVTVVWVIAGVAAVAPELAGTWVERNIYKQRDRELGMFHARERVWADSYDAAVEGGTSGLGYGVSSGSDPSQLGRFGTYYYTREKGNSQLAIVEETGLIGFGLYLLLLAVLFRQLLAGFWRSPHGELRIVRGLIAGTMAGLVAQSMLEAWWVGPGSLEFVFFWAMGGTGLALTRFARADRAVTARHARLRRVRASA